jgi:hypothetical protein
MVLVQPRKREVRLTAKGMHRLLHRVRRLRPFIMAALTRGYRVYFSPLPNTLQKVSVHAHSRSAPI